MMTKKITETCYDSGIAKYEKKTAAEVVSRYYISPLNVCGGLAEAQNWHIGECCKQVQFYVCASFLVTNT